MNYKLFIQNSDASKKWEVPYKQFSFYEELNADRSANISFDTSVVKALGDITGDTIETILSGTYREVYIQDSSANTIYSGYVSSVQFSRGGNDGGTISLLSKGFFNLLGRRYTDSLRTYSSQDKSDYHPSLK